MTFGYLTIIIVARVQHANFHDHKSITMGQENEKGAENSEGKERQDGRIFFFLLL